MSKFLKLKFTEEISNLSMLPVESKLPGSESFSFCVCYSNPEDVVKQGLFDILVYLRSYLLI